MRRSILLLILLSTAVSCGSDETPVGPAVREDGPTLTVLQPNTIVDGSLLVVEGNSFVPPESGSSRLQLRGSFRGVDVEISAAARFTDYNRMEIDWPGAASVGLTAGHGFFDGEARIIVESSIDGATHLSPPLKVSLNIADTLEPTLKSVSGGVAFVNSRILVEGEDFLLGGNEGITTALLEGCFQRDGDANCDTIGGLSLTCDPEKPFSRDRCTFAFDPRIAGIHPGTFIGKVSLRNNPGGLPAGATTSAQPITVQLSRPAVFSLSPSTSSLGQYVFVTGGGFVGGADQSLTTLEFKGSFTPKGGSPMNTNLSLVPEFVSGELVRYVLNEDDELGKAVDLRNVSGSFDGTVQPVTLFGAETESGDPVPMTLKIGGVRQVIYLRFMPSFVESLRHFGLRAADQRIRDRVFQVARRDYQGVNVDFRDTVPQDFALYEQVEVSGPDPNGLGMLGYDNTPGKDKENMRLYDKIGGVNATTQEDGYPGYGGVFVESFFGFSTDPGVFAKKLDGADPLFDAVFDPFRSDRGGSPVTAEELGAGIPELTSGDACPSTERPTQIACAVWALGSMIGTTLTHEIGHSLGLADPYGADFHNPGDVPGRLMDSGGARDLPERVEIGGKHGAFCDSEFDYLRQILPTEQDAPSVSRPSCF